MSYGGLKRFEEIKKKAAAIDRGEPRVVLPPPPEPPKEEPEFGPFYSIYKRDVLSDTNARVFQRLLWEEANARTVLWNREEARKRRMAWGLEPTKVLEHVWLYDCVQEDDAAQRSKFWNPRPCVVAEGSKPELDVTKPKDDVEWVG